MKKILITFLVLLSLPIATFASEIDVNSIPNTLQEDAPLKINTESFNILDKNDTSIKEISEEEVHDLIEGKDLKDKTVQEIADLYEISAETYAEKLSETYDVKIKPKDSFQLLHDNYSLEPSIAKEIAASLKMGKDIDIEIAEKEYKQTYHLIPITVFFTLLYFLMKLLIKTKKITILTHRKIWNVILLITFMITGVLGILLVIKENFGTVFQFPFNILFWHVEIGIAMFIICIFHIIERWYFFKNLIVRGK